MLETLYGEPFFRLMCSFFCPVDYFGSPMLIWRRLLDKKICHMDVRDPIQDHTNVHFRNYIYHLANLCPAGA